MTTKFLISVLTALIVLSAMPALAQEQGQEQAQNESAPPPAREDRPRRERKRSLFPDDVAGLEELARNSYAEGNNMRYLQANIKLRQQRPYAPEYMYAMVVAYALLERPTSAYDYMLKMQQQGLSYDLTETEGTENIRDTQVFEYLNDLMIRAGDPAGVADKAFELPGEAVAPEAIDWDESREMFLIGSRVSGAVVAVNEDGEAEELLRADEENGLWAIRDLQVDEENNRLWITSTASPAFSAYDPADEGKGALFEFNLKTLALLNRFDMPADGSPHEPGAMVLTPEGHLYIIDHAASMVMRKGFDEEVITAFAGNPDMTSLSDIAVAPGGQRLYVADMDKGVLVIDLKNQVSAMLTGPETLNLGGIESLFFWGNNLAIMQSSISPQRLLRLELDAAGGAATSVTPMAIAVEGFDQPGRGVVMGESIYYLANGRPREAVQEDEPFIIMRTPLESGEQIVPPDMRKFEEETLNKARGN